MLAAQVIEASADNTSHTIFINRGERDHVRNNLGVITPDGIVGKIVEVFPSTAQVLLLNDKDSGVGALFVGYPHSRRRQRQWRSRAPHGLCRERRKSPCRRANSHIR